MNGSVAWRLLLLSVSAFAVCTAAPAAELACSRYVPAVDKLVAVPCEEFEASVPPAPVPPAPPPAAGEDGLSPIFKFTKALGTTVLEDMTTALLEAKADTPFRETYCTMNATAQLLHQEKDQSEARRLQSEHAALEAQLGERGKRVYMALQDEDRVTVMLATPVVAAPYTSIRQTPVGQAFLKARDGLRMSCNCMREESPPKRMICCDACSKEALQARF